MLVTTKKLFENCYGKYGIAAINVDFMEQILALFSAAEKANAPFIVQTTPLARDYASPEMLIAMVKAAHRLHPNVIFALHLDHGNEDHIAEILKGNAYTSVMIDASHDSFENNIARTKNVTEAAHQKGISVEAELGVLAGVEDDLSVDESQSFYTDPAQVETFVEATNCDSLAIAVGTSHGAYKFSGGQGIQFEILEKIQQKLPGFPLVLHGGSAINRKEIGLIRKAGGTVEETAKGVDPVEVQRAISYGVCKINIATDFRLLWTRINREFFRDRPAEFHPVVPGKEYMASFEKMALEKFEYLHAVGRGSTFKN